MAPGGFQDYFLVSTGLQQARQRFSIKLIDQSPESKYVVSVVKL